MPIATGRSGKPPTKSRGRSPIGMLSMASNPMSSSASIAVVRPAPAGPLTITICCACSGRPASVTAYPARKQTCLPVSVGKSVAVLHEKAQHEVKIWECLPGNQF